MIIFLSPLICLIGLLMWVLASNPKVAEIGKLMFAIGLFVSLLSFNPALIRLLPKGE